MSDKYEDLLKNILTLIVSVSGIWLVFLNSRNGNNTDTEYEFSKYVMVVSLENIIISIGLIFVVFMLTSLNSIKKKSVELELLNVRLKNLLVDSTGG